MTAGSALVVDAGWVDWRLADSPDTRVSQAQAETLLKLDREFVESVGAAEVRFGDEFGELCFWTFDEPDVCWLMGVDGVVCDESGQEVDLGR